MADGREGQRENDVSSPLSLGGQACSTIDLNSFSGTTHDCSENEDFLGK